MKNNYRLQVKDCKFLLVVLICNLQFVTCNCFAQQNKIDSLQKLLLTQREDTSQINILLSLEYEYASFNPDSALGFATEAKKIAKKIKNNKLLAKSCNALGWDNYVKGNYAEALNNYFVSLKISEELKDKNGIGKSLNIIGILFSDQEIGRASCRERVYVLV